MNSIILCEGKTDVTLIGYYLEKCAKWEYDKKGANEPIIYIRNSNTELVKWYKKENNYLAIWGIGSKSNFNYAIGEIFNEINFNVNIENAFTNIVFVSDKDTSTDEEILIEFQSLFNDYKINLQIQIDEWNNCIFTNRLEEEIQIKVLLITIPSDGKGALEEFLLNAFYEDKDKKCIIDELRKFIPELSDKCSKYLPKKILKKVELDMVLSIILGHRGFSPIDKMLKQIEWEKYGEIQNGFKLLEEI